MSDATVGGLPTRRVNWTGSPTMRRVAGLALIGALLCAGAAVALPGLYAWREDTSTRPSDTSSHQGQDKLPAGPAVRGSVSPNARPAPEEPALAPAEPLSAEQPGETGAADGGRTAATQQPEDDKSPRPAETHKDRREALLMLLCPEGPRRKATEAMELSLERLQDLRKVQQSCKNRNLELFAGRKPTSGENVPPQKEETEQ